MLIVSALSGARSQEFHSSRHMCCDDVTIKVIWFDLFRCWKYVSIVRFSACKNVSKCTFYRTTFYVKYIWIIMRPRCYVNVSLKGTVCPQKCVVGIFISDKAAYMSVVLLCVQPLPEKPLYLLLKRHLVAESEFVFPVCLSYVQINANIDPCFYAANIEL